MSRPLFSNASWALFQEASPEQRNYFLEWLEMVLFCDSGASFGRNRIRLLARLEDLGVGLRAFRRAELQHSLGAEQAVCSRCGSPVDNFYRSTLRCNSCREKQRVQDQAIRARREALQREANYRRDEERLARARWWRTPQRWSDYKPFKFEPQERDGGEKSLETSPASRRDGDDIPGG